MVLYGFGVSKYGWIDNSFGYPSSSIESFLLYSFSFIKSLSTFSLRKNCLSRGKDRDAIPTIFTSKSGRGATLKLSSLFGITTDFNKYGADDMMPTTVLFALLGGQTLLF